MTSKNSGAGGSATEAASSTIIQSADMDYAQVRARLDELETLEGQLARELEEKRAESIEAMILGQPYDLSGIADTRARLEQVRAAVEVLEKRVQVYRRMM